MSRDASDAARPPNDADTGGIDHSGLIQGLQAAEATYRLLVEGIPAVIYIDAVDDASTNLYTSPQVEEMLGIPQDEWSKSPNTWLDRMHPEDRERVRVENLESNANGTPFRSEYRMVTPGGRVVWVRDEAVLVRDEDGTPLFWRGVMLDITELKNAEEKLRRSLEILSRTMEQRRVLVARLEDAQEQERRRIAADIHDDSIQVMSAVDLRVLMLTEQAEAPEVREAMQEIHAIVSLAIERLRHLMFELRPPALGTQGLASALRAYLEQLGPEATFAWEIEDRVTTALPADVAATAFRIAREAIHNVVKHAAASRLDVIVEQRDGGLQVTLADDGRGLDAASERSAAPGHVGVAVMRERAELAGGWWRAVGGGGGGVRVVFWLPFGPAGTGTGG